MSTRARDLGVGGIFVVGPLRSGTTLLRLLISAHPEVSGFGEFECSVSEATGESWPDLNDFYRFLDVDRQSRAHEFSIDKSLAYPELIHSFWRQKANPAAGGLTCASVHSRIDLLPKLFPKAKYIHILRDPRDVASSCIGMGWVGNVYSGVDYWVHAESAWDQLVHKYPDTQRLNISYEELVSQPEKILAGVCTFLGIEYSDKMLDIEGNTTYSRPNPKFANQWKIKLAARDIYRVESKCRDLMLLRGYKPASSEQRKISTIEKSYLALNNRVRRVFFSIKRYGLKLWLTYMLAKRLPLGRFAYQVRMQINEAQERALK